VRAIRDVLTPNAEEVDRAQRVVREFEAGRARGEDRVLVDGLWIEVPAYLNAKRLLERAAQFASADVGRTR
jgi:citrate lyase beta subunit